MKVSPETLKRLRKWGITGPVALLPRPSGQPVLGNAATRLLEAKKGVSKRDTIRDLEAISWKDWQEYLHPRGSGGKFAPSGNEPVPASGLFKKFFPQGAPPQPVKYEPLKIVHPVLPGPALPQPAKLPKLGQVLPHGMDAEEAKKMPLDSSWERAKNWKDQAYGGVIVNGQGQFLIREPANHFDNYVWTWPKGKMQSADEHPVDTATREVREETGLDTRIIGPLPGNYKSWGSNSNFFMMRAGNYNPDEQDRETWNKGWASYATAKQYLGMSKNKVGRERDLAILENAHNYLQHYGEHEITALWDESLHPRGPHGKFAPNPSAKSDTPASTLKMHGWENLNNTSSKFEQNWEHPAHGLMRLKYGLKPAGGLKPLTWEHSLHNGTAVENGPLSYRAKNLHTYLETLHQNATGAPFGKTAAPVTPAPVAKAVPVPTLYEPPEGMAKEYENVKLPGWTAKFNPVTGLYDKYDSAGGPGIPDIPPSVMKDQVENQKVYQPNDKAPPAGMPAAFFHPDTNEKYVWDWMGKNYVVPNKEAEMPVAYVKKLQDELAVDGHKLEEPTAPPKGMQDKYIAKSGGMSYQWNGKMYVGTETATGKVGNAWTPTTLQKWKNDGTVVEAKEPESVQKPSGKPPNGMAVVKDSPGPIKALEPVEHPQKKSGPPEGMPIAIKGPKGGLYKWNDGQQAYVHSKTGKYTVTPKEAQKHLSPGLYPSGKSWKVAEGSYTKGMYKPEAYQAQPQGKYKGLPASFKSGKTGNTYVWSDEKKVYVNSTLGTVLHNKPEKISTALGAGTYVSTDPNYKGTAKVVPPEAKPAAPSAPAQIKIVEPKSYAPGPKSGLSGPTDVKGVEYTPPTVSTTAISHEPPPAASLFTYKPDQPNLGGAHEKYVFTDKNGGDWLFKPSTTIGGKKDPVFAAADAVTSKIAMAMRPGYSVEAHAMTLNIPGKGDVYGSLQKMIPANVLRGEGGKYKDFTGRDLNAVPLKDWEVRHLQQEQVLDWLIGNHDAHAGQFLRTSGQYVGSRSTIGIDKSQAWKFFPNDKLSADYHPNKEEQPPFYNKMWAQVKAGKTQFNPGDAFETIKKAEGISDADYKDILKPYVQARYGVANSPAAQKFLDAAVARKDSLRSDFEKFYSGILGHKFVFDPIIDPNSKYVVNSPGKKYEILPDKEERPNNQKMIQDELPTMMGKYPGITGKADLSFNVVKDWESKYYKTDATLPDEQRWQKAAQGSGLYPEMAAKLGLLPSDLSKLRSSIDQLKSDTATAGASNLRAAAQEVIAPKGETLKSRFAATLQLEHEITKAKLSQLYPGGTIDVYRGLHNPVAADLKKAKASGAGIIQYHMMGTEGFSDNYSTASAFSDGVVLHPDAMSIGNVISSHQTSPGAWTSLKSEAESIIAFPGKIMHLKPHEIQVKGSHMRAAKNSKVYHVDGTKQSNISAYPPGWNAPGKKYPVELIEMTVVYPEPDLKQKVSAAIEEKLKKAL